MAHAGFTPEGWSVAKSAELYNLPGWGSPYVSIGRDGRVVVHPDGEDGPRAALEDIVAAAEARGLSAPLLIRFDGILRARVRAIRGAFERAIAESGYGGRYRPVYPIKVNQQRRVAEVLMDSGTDLGLEVGSKPEMLAVVALLSRPSLIVCNGYKDATYIDLAFLARRLGHEVVVVVEKPSEIELVARIARIEGPEAVPFLGVRSRLAHRGAGRWESSGGDRAKFGLSARQLVEAVARLDELGLLGALRLLHFHLGSQITSIRPWKDALREASRTFIELRRLGAPLDLFDVGGGLAVDYDGSRTNYESSMNYTELEYAADVCAHVQDACERVGEAVPDIVTESGRALVAHHSVLVAEVIGTSRLAPHEPAPQPRDLREDDDEVYAALVENLHTLSRKNVQEVYHDAIELRDEMLVRFNVGLVDLAVRARCETVFYATLRRVQRLIAAMDYVPDEFDGIEKALAETYFCNFSLFQSVPDHWAIRQLFPVMPITRLHEQPTVRAVLADMTCDSDGRMDRFVDLRDVKDVLEVHRIREGERYHLGIFLLGAYQEILGDLHNLFGDTDAVHVDFDERGELVLVDCLEGERVGEVLRYVDYDLEWLRARYASFVERIVADGQLTESEGREVREELDQALRGDTYLTPPRDEPLLEGADPLGAPASRPLEHGVR